jgi:hypothetical protein
MADDLADIGGRSGGALSLNSFFQRALQNDETVFFPNRMGRKKSDSGYSGFHQCVGGICPSQQVGLPHKSSSDCGRI